jgi:hypothetical protein
MKTTTTAEAFKAWASSPACTCPGDDPHFMASRKTRTYYKTDDRVATEVSVPRPDNQVCERERNWRLYISLRDAVPRNTCTNPIPGFTARYGFGAQPTVESPLQPHQI